MHEMALARGIVETLGEEARRHEFTHVLRVKLSIGVLGHVDPDALAFGFDVAAAGTLAAGAVLEIERPAGAARCLDCDANVSVASRADLCPKCGGAHLVVTGGGGMTIREMEVA